MKIILKMVGVVLAVAIVAALGGAYWMGMILNPSPTEARKERSMYDFMMKDIDGNDVKLEKYKGNVVMLVNTASRCGLTPQYEGLQAIYDKYKDRGFTVLGFPANNFMGQEPGTDAEIKEFCTLNYSVSFPMFSKISVKGADQHPLYSFLTHKETNPGMDGDITWNFEKFLADRNGRMIARFSPRTLPTDPAVIEAIERALSDAEAEAAR
ncbi:MAG TPA: glutathione peroxidase [Pyrinomonadaceae bacterium]|nr:glutathione peroxidase [Pyrinomonadaceae bacterium]HMP65751.1 glutathione peroxidase [Pyrinomonadaceae bacterium]